jgi:hypothetical protein
MHVCKDDGWWVHDRDGVPLTKVCEACEGQKLSLYGPKAWHTDEYGIQRFSSPVAPGWELIIRPERPERLDVISDDNYVEVLVEPDGIEVFGEDSSGESFSAVRFTIPWVILREIIRFQDSKFKRV